MTARHRPFPRPVEQVPECTAHRAVAPPGEVSPIALARFDTRRADAGAPGAPANSGGWAWSPHGVGDAHVPELFPRIRFADGPPPPA